MIPILSLLLAFSPLLAVSKLPVRIFHSYSGYCDKMKYKGDAICVETATAMDTILKSIDQQAQIGCAKLKAEADRLAQGFHIVGYSQGGLVARTIFQKCAPLNKQVRRLVLISTPHVGVSQVPMFPGMKMFLSPTLNLDKVDAVLLKKLFPKLTQEQAVKLASKSHEKTNVERIKKVRTLLTYLKSNTPIPPSEAWISTSAPATYYAQGGMPTPFLRDFNSKKYDPLFAKLDLFVNIVSKNDTVIVPVGSNTFGAEISGDMSSIADASGLPYIIEHEKGVGGLYNTGKLWNCLTDAAHGMTKTNESKLIYEVLLKDDPNAETHAESAKNALSSFLAAYPNKCTGKGN